MEPRGLKSSQRQAGGKMDNQKKQAGSWALGAGRQRRDRWEARGEVVNTDRQ